MVAKKQTTRKKTTRKSTSSEVKNDPKIGNYFLSDEKDVQFFSSGCLLFDKALGGGYPLGRIVNIVGDKSSGKSLLAIEASANFSMKFEKFNIWYNEAESAFDKGYARALGMPVDSITFVNEDTVAASNTVEGLFKHLEEVCDKSDGTPGLYIIDSLDALSDTAEMSRDIDAGTMGAGKAKKLSELFRRLIRKLEKANITMFVISQIRDKIGITFGRKQGRSGGKALDFYSSQIIWLSELGKIRKVVKKVDRPIGIRVRARLDKNKVGLPYRECEFPLIFGYGVDDLLASLEWLKLVDSLDLVDVKPTMISRTIRKMENGDKEEYFKFKDKVSRVVTRLWQEIEESFLPTRTKY